MKPAVNDNLALEFERIGLDYNRANQLRRFSFFLKFFKITDKIAYEGELGAGKLIFSIAADMRERDGPAIAQITLKIQRNLFKQAGDNLTIEKLWIRHLEEPLPHKSVMIAEVLAKERIAVEEFRKLKNVQAVRETFTKQDPLKEVGMIPPRRR